SVYDRIRQLLRTDRSQDGRNPAAAFDAGPDSRSGPRAGLGPGQHASHGAVRGRLRRYAARPIRGPSRQRGAGAGHGAVRRHGPRGDRRGAKGRPRHVLAVAYLRPAASSAFAVRPWWPQTSPSTKRFGVHDSSTSTPWQPTSTSNPTGLFT